MMMMRLLYYISISKKTYFDIPVPAKIASFDESFTATYKEDVKLPCLAVGVPSPNIIWKVINLFIYISQFFVSCCFSGKHE